MKGGRKGRRIVFTIVKLVLLIIIVVLLVAIAIPRYRVHVESKRTTEATRIMGAIIISQKVEKHRTGKYYNASTVAEFQSRGITITNTKYFTYETTVTPNGGFTVTATPTDAFGVGGQWLKYIKEPGRPGMWTYPSDPELYPMPRIEPYIEPYRVTDFYSRPEKCHTDGYFAGKNRRIKLEMILNI